MSKIILGIKDDNRPMAILGFEGNYSIQNGWDDETFGFNHHYYRGSTKITLETNRDGIEFASFKGALNYIYGGRSGYQRELATLRYLETKDNPFRINYHMFGISKVISHEPATIVFWKDGTKTVVKCQEGDTYDLEKGILYAIIRKVYGEGRNYTNILNIIDESCETYDHTKANEAFWNHEKEPIDETRATKFLNDLEKLCYKYDISISHEDIEGAFILEPYYEENVEWLRAAKRNGRDDLTTDERALRVAKGKIKDELSKLVDRYIEILPDGTMTLDIWFKPESSLVKDGVTIIGGEK